MTSIPEISARGSLILWAKFQIPVGPRSGREGEKCRPLDHIRQIPYVHPALFLSYTGIIFCIYAKDFHRFHPYGNHIASWYNVDLSFTHALLQNHLLRNHLLMHRWCSRNSVTLRVILMLANTVKNAGAPKRCIWQTQKSLGGKIPYCWEQRGDRQRTSGTYIRDNENVSENLNQTQMHEF